MTTEGDIYNAWVHSTTSSRVTLEECFSDVKGEKISGIYEIFEGLNNSLFSVVLIHSDGGVKDFFVMYQFGEYSIVITRVQLYTFDGKNVFEKIDSLSNFISWLNIQEKRIKSTAVLQFLE